MDIWELIVGKINIITVVFDASIKHFIACKDFSLMEYLILNHMIRLITITMVVSFELVLNAHFVKLKRFSKENILLILPEQIFKNFLC